MRTRRVHEFLPQIKDLYTVYEDGTIWSDRVGKMKTRNRPGTTYQIINFMTVEGKKQTFRVHILVMMAFKPCDNMETLEVNHIDGVKTNNALSNLEWCTPQENQLHAFRIGLQKPRKGESSNFAKLTEGDVKEVFRLRKQGLTQQAIGDIIGCSKSNISCILKGKSWSSMMFNDQS